MRITGGCHCGFVRYEATIDPGRVTICHCKDCQVLTGSAYRITAAVRRDDLRLTANAPKLYRKLAESGRMRLQYFCPECGTPLFTAGIGADNAVWGIRVGTIAERDVLVPARQFWCRSALSWSADLTPIPGLDADEPGRLSAAPEMPTPPSGRGTP